MPWQDSALCAQADPELFFPATTGTESESVAKKICTRCEVRSECLDHAVVRDERYGIWGGLSEQERRQMVEYHPEKR